MPEELPIIIISGSDILVQNLLTQHLFDLRTLAKPVTPARLLDAAATELARYEKR
jgi:hypothetical protein